MKRLVAVLCLLAVVCVGCKSTGTFHGRLVSKTTGQPIAGATVVTPSGTATTDSNGGFSVSGLAIGSVQAKITAPGFEPVSQDLKVTDSETATMPVEFPDASLRVVVTETAVERAAVQNAIVHLGETTAAVQPDGTFKASGLPSGDVTMSVEAAGHEASSSVVALAAGDNVATMTLSLTAKATYQRYYDAYAFGRFTAAYKYLHADIRKKESYKQFVKDMKASGTDISLKMAGQRVLTSWHSKRTKRTYHQVTEIDRTIVFEWFGRKYTDKLSQHWVKVKGAWYIIWAS